MLFKLRVLNNGKEEDWTYDNLKNIVYDAEGKDRYTQYKSKEYRITYPFNGEDTQYKIRPGYVTVLYISMGLKCNFHCKYCYQCDLSKDLIGEASPSKVKKLVEMLEKSPIKPTIECVLWGGDPLVYWKTTKLLIPELRRIYPKINLSFVTNGSLVSDEVFELCRKYKVKITISYDGRDTLRDYPVFDDPVVFNATKKAIDEKTAVNVLPLITSNGNLPNEIYKELTEKFGRPVHTGYHSIFKCNSDNVSNAKVGWLTPERVSAVKQMYYQELDKEPTQCNRALVSRLDEVRNAIVRGIPYNSSRTACAMSTGAHVAIDFDGNVLACMNRPFQKCGNFKEYTKVKNTSFYSHQLKKKCLACPWLNACFGVCPMVKDENSLAFKINCNNFGPLVEVLVVKAIETLFGVHVLSFNDVPVRQGIPC